MEPIFKRKVGSILEALEEATCSTFNLRDLENEIGNILSPLEGGLPKKEGISTKTEEPVRIGENFSFVRHKEEAIPGLSIGQDVQDNFARRENFSGIGRRIGNERGRGGYYHARGGQSEEEKESNDPFTERRPSYDVRRSSGEGNSSRGGFDQGINRNDDSQRRFDSRGGGGFNNRGRGFDRGPRRGFDRGRGAEGDRGRFTQRSNSTSSGYGGHVYGGRPRGGGFDRGRGDGRNNPTEEQRRYFSQPRSSSGDRGTLVSRPGFGANPNQRRGNSNRRFRRRKMTPEEDEANLQRMLARDAIAERAILEAAGQLPSLEPSF